MFEHESASVQTQRPQPRGLALALIVAYLMAAAVVMGLVVEPGLKGEGDWSFWGDSLTYEQYARVASLPLLSFWGNYVGPVLLLRAVNYSDWIIFALNCALFLIAYLLVAKLFAIRRLEFLLLLFLNPMLFVSLLAVNKEIMGFVGVVLFVCYLWRGQIRYLAPALVLSVAARWHQAVVIVLFLILIHKWTPRRPARHLVLAAVILLISVVYPLLPAPAINALGYTSLVGLQESKAGGLLLALNDLERHFGYFVAVVPKVLLNWFGNLGRVQDIFWPSADFDTHNLYNYAVLGHQLAMCVVTCLLVLRKRLTLASPLIYFAALYSIAYALSLFIQYRYFFPLYGLLCLEACRRPTPATVADHRVPGSAGAPAGDCTR